MSFVKKKMSRFLNLTWSEITEAEKRGDFDIDIRRWKLPGLSEEKTFSEKEAPEKIKKFIKYILDKEGLYAPGLDFNVEEITWDCMGGDYCNYSAPIEIKKDNKVVGSGLIFGNMQVKGGTAVESLIRIYDLGLNLPIDVVKKLKEMASESWE
ncbi:MAG: hypothetical protein ACP5M7_09215 [Thermoproteota archaeon]